MWYEDAEAKVERKIIEISAETPGGAAETVEKSKLNSSCEAEEKNQCTKNELNLLTKPLIIKCGVIIT